MRRDVATEKVWEKDSLNLPVVFSLTTHLVAATMSGKEGAIDSSSSRAAQQAHE